VEVDDCQFWQAENVVFEDLPVCHHDKDVGIHCGDFGGGIANFLRLKHGDACLDGGGLNRGRLHLLMPAYRLVRLGYKSERFGSGIEKVTKGWQRDVPCSDENQSHVRAMKF
jgi:hypothetical protein